MNLNETLKVFGSINKSIYGIDPYKVDSIEGLSGEEERLAVKAINETCFMCDGTRKVIKNEGYCGGCEKCGSTEEEEVACPECSQHSDEPW